MEDFAPFELAVKLKEKGFDCSCIGHYVNNQLYIAHYLNAFHSDNDESLDAPTISQVLKWLREEKKLHIVIIIWGKTWGYNTIELPSGRSLHWTAYQEDIKSYEDAAIAGIEYVLDNLI